LSLLVLMLRLAPRLAKRPMLHLIEFALGANRYLQP